MNVEAVEIRELPSYRGWPDGKGGEKVLMLPFHVVVSLSDGTAYTVAVRLDEGYAFDGASIPRALWRVCGHPFESPRDAAALIHDWCYASRFFPRSVADEIYYRAQVALGIPKYRAWVERTALRLVGWFAWGVCDADDRALAVAHAEVMVNLHRADLEQSPTLADAIEDYETALEQTALERAEDAL